MTPETWQTIAEISFTFLIITLGGLATFQMYHNTKSDTKKESLQSKIEERHLSLIERMEKNQERSDDRHSELMEKMSGLQEQMRGTTAELHNTNTKLTDLAETVTFVIRDQIPSMKEDIAVLKTKIDNR